MEHNSWKNVNFTYPPTIPTMISQEEKQYLFWLGQSVWQGQGAVVEIGPWLGGSTVSLAAGMRASGHDTAAEQLHTCDNFIWRDFMADRAQLPIKSGDSFYPYFLENIRDYKQIIKSYVQALPDEVIESDDEAGNKRFFESDEIPIFQGISHHQVEILFVDGAKSWRGTKHLLNVLREKLIPKAAFLVCQDYKYWGTYWVPIMMSRLGEHLKAVHNTLTGTTVTFQLLSEIPQSFIDALEDHVVDMNSEQCLQEIDQASSLLAADGDALGSMNVQLSKVSFLSHQGKLEQAVEAFEQIQQLWPNELNIGQLERAREYLQSERGYYIPRPPNLQKTYCGQRMKRALRRIKRLAKA